MYVFCGRVSGVFTAELCGLLPAEFPLLKSWIPVRSTSLHALYAVVPLSLIVS